jgi:predicted TIM-barrel fold metal-dependent hydrolase
MGRESDVTIPIESLTGGWTGKLIDADVHAAPPSIAALHPYLEPHWSEFATETGFIAPTVPAAAYPPGVAVTTDPRWTAGGATPARDLATVQRDVLDPLGIGNAVLNCWWGVDSVRHPDYAAGLARALNDWMIAEWLERDDRLRGSIVMPAHDPASAAREIDRVGGHPGVVQGLLPVRSSRLYGQRVWHPMFEALTRNDLVAGIHYGGQGDGPPSPTGWPSWFLEEYVSAIQGYHAQVTSLVAEGTFQKFPSLRVSLLEGGFTWLPSLMWRLDKEWKGLRRDIPWVREPPSKTLRERVRVSVQPLDAGPVRDLARVIEWIGSDDMLMFSTDYPHGHGQDLALLLSAMPKSSHPKLMSENARAQYQL